MSVVTLRDVDGFPPARRSYPEAEYELLIAAMDPDTCPPDPDENPPSWGVLTSPDVAYQFHGLTEKRAAEIAKCCMLAIVNGSISPDQDYRKVWMSMLDEFVAFLRAYDGKEKS